MYEYFMPRRSRYLAQVATLALMASFLAGCSSDASRFMGNTSNQRSILSGQQGGAGNANNTYRDSDVTGSVSTGTVTRTPLPPAPSYSGPSYSGPSYTPPSYQTPSYTPPRVQSPSVSAPTYTAPTYTAPSYTAPSYQPPRVEAPRVTAPAYTPPSYQAPRVEAPRVEAPRVAAPTYTAPAYTPPQVTAPTARLPQVSATAPNYTAPRVEASLPPAPQVDQTVTGTVRGPVRQVGPTYPAAQAPSVQAPAVQAPAAAIPASTAPARTGWSSTGGTAVTLRQGENIDTLALRYGVPRDALMRANNITDPYSLQAGQQVVIPTYVSASAAAQANASQPPAQTAALAPPAPVQAPAAPMAPKPVSVTPVQPPRPVASVPPAAAAPSQAKAAGATHTVTKGENLARVAYLYGVSERQIMAANGMSSDMIRIGQRLVIPGATDAQVRTAAIAQAKRASGDTTVTGSTGPAATQSLPPASAKPVAVKTVSVAPAPASSSRAAAPTQPSAPVASTRIETVKTAPIAPAATPAVAATSDANPNLAWPVRGKVVREFGQKPNGERSEGISIAVPEGTTVKSAADGEVIYAGSELKGYGNLVLVRHPNGYVTAYGYNSDILVKRGDKVRAGQPVAKSGATGGVKEPQLHFEVRKGQRPVDPKALLAAN